MKSDDAKYYHRINTFAIFYDKITRIQELLIGLNFDERIKGDHHIFTKNGIDEILNLQPKGSKAKPYQIRQVRSVIVKYNLGWRWCIIHQE